MNEIPQYCTFLLDGNLFGLEVGQVQEVLRGQTLTRVPLAPAVVRGLINLRGQIVTAIDLRRRLQMPPRDELIEAMNIVVRTEEGTMSFLVDEIGDVIEVEESAFEKPPETLHGVGRELVRGAYKLKSKLLLVLNTDVLMKL